MEMVRSVDKYFPNYLDITFHVFTEHTISTSKLNLSNRANLKIHKIPNYGWPEATILRYRVIGEFKTELSEDILMHLDADMLVRREVPFKNYLEISASKLFFVAHPGYWRPVGFERASFYLINPKTFIKDLFKRLILGGIGSWETSRKSHAFVPRSLRKEYACGAVWFGSNKQIIEFAQSLSEQVDADYSQSVMAKWHDESHLNSWISRNSHILLNPELCYDPSYPNLAKIKNVIEAVQK